MSDNTEMLLAQVKEVLASYSGVPITLRQLYYRLVAKGYIVNTLNSYSRLIGLTSKWRKAKRLPMDAFVDRTRAMIENDLGWYQYNPKLWLQENLKRMLKANYEFDLNLWYGQPKRVVVAVEKQALQGVFEPVMSSLGMNLIIGRGYPSLSFLREVSIYLDTLYEGQSNNLENVLLYFGDWDPSGLDIPEAIKTNLNEVFNVDFTYEHIALEEEQIESMNLIPAPAKKADPRAGNFIRENGENVYELDAVEPKTLNDIIRQSVLKHYDFSIAEKRKKDIASGKEWIQNKSKELGLDAMMHINNILSKLNNDSEVD